LASISQALAHLWSSPAFWLPSTRSDICIHRHQQLLLVFFHDVCSGIWSYYWTMRCRKIRTN